MSTDVKTAMNGISESKVVKARSKTRTKTYTWPIFFAVLSLVGLISALLGDGVWDSLSWLTLGLPTAVCVWILFGARRF